MTDDIYQQMKIYQSQIIGVSNQLNIQSCKYSRWYMYLYCTCMSVSYGTVAIKLKIWQGKLIEIAHEYMEP
jgi:hypothetical protein